MKVDAANGKATIYWSINRTDSIPISGYKIYIAKESDIPDTTRWRNFPGNPYNLGLYPGDTDGDIYRESFPLDNLANGAKYYAIVKTVGPDGRESKPSELVSFRPLARGEFLITANHLAIDGGFNFESQSSVPGRDPRSDLYLFATESKTGLSSPSRLGAGLRKTMFSRSGQSGSESLQIAADDKISARIKAGDVDLEILSIKGRYPDVAVRIGYIFYPGGR